VGILADREFNLEGWGKDKRLIEGTCGHCNHAVAFKEPDNHACLEFHQTLYKDNDEQEQRTHYFIMGICPRPRCQQATIVYRQESQTVSGNYQGDEAVIEERIIFPTTSNRKELSEIIPQTLRELYREASSVEHLSPNGSAFLASILSHKFCI
jgi:hypothetical protein